MVNYYRKGRIAEKKVSGWLKSHGFTNVKRSKGSRGPYDLYARSPSGVKTYAQVKSGKSRLTKREREKLREIAKKRGGFAVYLHYNGRGEVKMTPLGNWAKRKRRRRK